MSDQEPTEALDVVLEFDIAEEFHELLIDKVGSNLDYFASVLAEEFKNAMYEKLLAAGRSGTRAEVLNEFIVEQAKGLTDAGELYLVPNPIRIP